MPLSWTEIRDRATAFQKRWKDESSEQAESQSFWSEFLAVFGVDRKRVAAFEKKVQLKRAKSIKNGRIDLFWPGKLLVEMKSAGHDLDRAFDQATDYFDALPERDLPRYVLVSDFQRFRLFDLEEGVDHPEFRLDQLRERVRLFGFIAGYNVQAIKPQDPVNQKAALRMGALHDALKASGYTGDALEVLLVRLLFCLFADDTGIFTPAQSFRDWIETQTRDDGSDLGRALNELFDILNTPEDQRQTTQRENFASFPYINGQLFAQRHATPAFDARMRVKLLDACALDWGTISPAIFGALFQSVMSDEARRKIGAHYTSEENILKLIKPLFLDELRAEFERIQNNPNKLKDFHQRLRTLTFFDPACGCGNFLVIAYRELRLLELDILRAVNRGPGSRFLNIHTELAIDVDQFYGIEIEEFPAQIAQVALWLTDHQMNRAVSDEFGAYYARIPLKRTPHIVHDNALTRDWQSVLPAEQCSYVLGNPPFIGKQNQSVAQKADVEPIYAPLKGGGVLDYVAAWYIKATHYLHAANRALTALPFEGGGAESAIRAAFVSTNSITQGEQVGVLWSWLLAQGVKIHFAHRTFRWSNEASGKAAVHCVIIGFGLYDVAAKTIYEYDDVNGEPHATTVNNINPYLVDADNIVLLRRSDPVCRVAPMLYGSKPVDDGAFLFDANEYQTFVAANPAAVILFRRFMGAVEFLHSEERWCLWLKDAPIELLRLKDVRLRIEHVKAFRERSTKSATREMAAFPALFAEDRHGAASYLVVPEVSSERRAFIPMAVLDSATIQSNLNYTIPDADSLVLGVMCSTMHNAWIRAVCGRLKSDFRYSAGIVYNNFPWPACVTREAGQRSGKEQAAVDAIEAAAQGVLDARAAHPESSLADLYDPLTMPPDLVKAHQKLDAAVDAAYFLSHSAEAEGGAKRAWKSDAERVAFLFRLYQRYTSLLPLDTPKKSRRKASA